MFTKVDLLSEHCMHMATIVIGERKCAVPNAESDALWLSFHYVLKSVIHRNCHPPTYLTFSIEVEEALVTHKLLRNGRENRRMLLRRLPVSERQITNY